MKKKHLYKKNRKTATYPSVYWDMWKEWDISKFSTTRNLLNKDGKTPKAPNRS